MIARSVTRLLASLLIVLSYSWASVAADETDETRARLRVETGWHDDFRSDRGWHKEPWEVAEPDEHADSSFSTNGATFTVPTPNHQMLWTRTISPVWVGDFPFLELDYEVSGLAAGKDETGVLVLTDDATGPITPGALNPENPAAAGGRIAVGPTQPGHHQLVLDLRTILKSDRIARFSLRMHSGEKPATLTIHRLAFLASDPGTQPAQMVASRPAGSQSHTTIEAGSNWQPLDLPNDPAVSTFWLERALSRSEPIAANLEPADVPFRWTDSARAALATGVMEIERIDLPGDWQGCELGLWLGARIFGSDQASFSTQPGPPRWPITSPHRLLVELGYADGVVRQYFPWSPARDEWSVTQGPETYVVPLEPDRHLVRVSLLDRMEFGQLFLLAASINTSSQPAFPACAIEPAPSIVAPVDAPSLSPTTCELQDDSLTIRNAWLDLQADPRMGLALKSMTIVPLGRQVITSERPVALLELLEENGQPIPLTLLRHQQLETPLKTVLTLTYNAGDPTGNHVMHVRLQCMDDGKLRIVSTLINDGDTPWNLGMICPRIEGCRLASEASDDFYLLGTTGTTLSNRPTRIEQPHSGLFPLQFIDLFSPQGGGGIALWVEDRHLLAKRFQFVKDDAGMSATVRYPRLSVPAGQSFVLPTAVIQPHLGDWHEPFERYRRWARQNISESRTSSLGTAFFCRRDYPLGGTDFLYDRWRQIYTPERLIAESQETLGGIDMIDISGWALNELQGRVGHYRTNDLGGLDQLRGCVDRAHLQNTKLGLYFEGYLIDRRSQLGGIGFPEWQLIDKNGEGRWWTGGMELFTCPGVPEWRQAFASTVADVAAATGADAVYIDQFGIAADDKACWSEAHGHPVPSNPSEEERAMLALIRKELDKRAPDTAIYIEYTPADAQMDLIDAAFDYSMKQPGGIPDETKLPLHRFVFPEVNFIEMIGYGIRPIPTGADDLHRCLFHGMAVWLKGRGESWYSPGFREISGRVHRILTEYADCFRSPRCEPHIPTLRGGLYANRFDGPQRTVVTVYNARPSDISGDLLRIAAPPSAFVQELWTDTPADVRRDDDTMIIRGHVAPWSATAFLIVH